MSGRCHENIVSHNTILDTQAQKTMKLPIHQDLKLPNIIEGNSIGE